jgi:hypothetical protein
MGKKKEVLGVRIDDETRARVERYESRTNSSGASLARAALVAALDHYEKNGERITFPIRVLPDEDKAKAVRAGSAGRRRPKSTNQNHKTP